MADFDRLGDLIGGVTPKGRSPSSRIAEAWPQVAGPDIARNSAPASFRAGRLIVATSSSAWAQTLQLMSPQLMAELNVVLGEELVGQMVFRTAGWSRVAPEGVAAAGPLGPAAAGGAEATGGRTGASLSADDEERVRAVAASACDPELGDRLAALMRACLLRQRKNPQEPGRP